MDGKSCFYAGGKTFEHFRAMIWRISRALAVAQCFVISAPSGPSIYIHYANLAMEISDHCVIPQQFSRLHRELNGKIEKHSRCGRLARNFFHSSWHSRGEAFDKFHQQFGSRYINTDCTCWKFVHFSFTHVCKNRKLHRVMCAARQRSRSVGNFSACSTHLSRVVIRLLISTQALLSCFWLARLYEVIINWLNSSCQQRTRRADWNAAGFTASRQTNRRATVYNARQLVATVRCVGARWAWWHRNMINRKHR